MKIITNISDINDKHLHDLFTMFISKYNCRRDDIEYILMSSYAFIVIIDDEDNVLAFARSISDGKLVYRIEDVFSCNNSFKTQVIKYLVDIGLNINVSNIEVNIKEDENIFLDLGFEVDDTYSVMRFK